MSNKVEFRANTQDEFIWKEVYDNNCYKLPDNMSGVAIVDIGANIGAFAISCLERGCDYVVCYEPDRNNFEILVENLSVFNAQRWSAFNSAVVGSKIEKSYHLSESYVVDNNIATGSKRLIPGDDKVNVILISIEDIGPVNIMPDADLWIKLDCEGCEHQIISSDVNWSRVSRIIGEVHSCSDGITSLHANKEDLPNWYFGKLDGSFNTFFNRLVKLGFNVCGERNIEDERLALFFADRKKLDNTTGFNDFWMPAVKTKNVTIITPFRNARKYLRLYFDQLSDLKSELSKNGFHLHSLIALEGDSRDGTKERIAELSSEYNIPLNIIDTTHGHIKWASIEDPIRMKVMSDIMNKGLNSIDDNTDIVVWIMSDLKWSATDLVDLIISAGINENNIYAPCVFIGEGDNKQFYDTWAFRWSKDERFKTYSFAVNTSGELTGAVDIYSAGTCLVMSKKIAKTCYAKDNEAVSFCEKAQYECFGVKLLPQVSIYHAPDVKYKILWIGDAVVPSGFGRVTHSIVPLLTEMGCEIDIVARNYFGEPHDYPYRIYPANVNGLYPGGEARAKILVASNKYDVVINLCDSWDVKGIMREFEDLKDNHNIDVPHVINWVTVDGKNVDLDMDKIPDYATILACTEFGKNELGLNAQVCPFGVDRTIFKPLDKVECRKVAASVAPEDAFIFGTVCVNQQRKRLDLLLREFSLFIKNNDEIDNVYLYLAISHTDREGGFDLKKLVDYYGLQGRVFVNQSALSDETLAMVYNAFDVFISVTQGEGFGLCALEAIACGIPCILSNNSAYSSWAKDSALMVECTEEIVTSPSNRMSYVVGSVPIHGQLERAMRVSYSVINSCDNDSEGSYSLLGICKSEEMSWENSAQILMNYIISSKDIS